jgi:hypothetical protein
VQFGGKTNSLTPSLFIEVPVPSQQSEWSCICVLGVAILPLSKICSIGNRKCSILDTKKTDNKEKKHR